MVAPVLTDSVVRLTIHALADIDPQLAGEDQEHARRFGWYPARSTRTSVRAAIRRWRREWRDGGSCRAFAIRDALSDDLAGGCEIRVAVGVAEVSYWIVPRYRGRGWAGRSLVLVVGWAAAELGVRRFVLEIEPDNGASIGVARHAGFRPFGERTDASGRPTLLFERDAPT